MELLYFIATMTFGTALIVAAVAALIYGTFGLIFWIGERYGHWP